MLSIAVNMWAGSGSEAIGRILDAAVAAPGSFNTGLTEQDLQRLMATALLRGVDPAQVLQLRGLPLAPQLTLKQLMSLHASVMQLGKCSELLRKLQQLPEMMALSPEGARQLLFAGGDPALALVAAAGDFCRGCPALQQQLTTHELLLAAAGRQYYNLMQVLLDLPAAQQLDVTQVTELLQQVPVAAGGRWQRGMVHAKLLQLPAAQMLELEHVQKILQEAVAVEHGLVDVINLLGKLPAARQLEVTAFDPILVAYMGTAGRVEGAWGPSGCCSLLTLPAVQGISSTAWVEAMEAAVSRGDRSEDDNDMAELLKLAAAQQLRSSEDLLPLLHVAMKQGHVQAVRGLVVLPAAQPGVLTSEGFWGACVTGVKAGFWGWYSCLPLNPFGQQLGPKAVAALLQEAVLTWGSDGVHNLVRLPAAKHINPKVLEQLLLCLLWCVESCVASGESHQYTSWANPPKMIPWSSELPDVIKSAMQGVQKAGYAASWGGDPDWSINRITCRIAGALLSLPAAEEIEGDSWDQLMQRSMPFDELEHVFQKVACRRNP